MTKTNAQRVHDHFYDMLDWIVPQKKTQLLRDMYTIDEIDFEPGDLAMIVIPNNYWAPSDRDYRIVMISVLGLFDHVPSTRVTTGTIILIEEIVKIDKNIIRELHGDSFQPPRGERCVIVFRVLTGTANVQDLYLEYNSKNIKLRSI